ncbi:hypothetical protein D0843_12205 [Bordetella avium]|nr:hypothetical protein D0843_12205 [Bordetella avium]
MSPDILLTPEIVILLSVTSPPWPPFAEEEVAEPKESAYPAAPPVEIPPNTDPPPWPAAPPPR